MQRIEESSSTHNSQLPVSILSENADLKGISTFTT